MDKKFNTSVIIRRNVKLLEFDNAYSVLRVTGHTRRSIGAFVTGNSEKTIGFYNKNQWNEFIVLSKTSLSGIVLIKGTGAAGDHAWLSNSTGFNLHLRMEVIELVTR